MSSCSRPRARAHSRSQRTRRALSSLAPAGATEQVRADLEQAAQRAHDAGYQPLPEYGRGPLKLILAAREQVSLPVTLADARCVRAYLLTGEPSARAQLWVAGAPVDAPAGEGEAVRFCAADKASANRTDRAAHLEQRQAARRRLAAGRRAVGLSI